MIAAPATTLTDYAIALESLGLALALGRFGPATRPWMAAFGSVSIATLLGGTYHGFGPYLPGGYPWLLWQGMLGALRIASFWLLLAVAAPYPPRGRTILQRLALLKLLLSLVLGGLWGGFGVAVVDYLSALALVLGLSWRSPQLAASGPTGSRVRRWMGAGMGLSGLAVVPLALPWPAWLALDGAVPYHLIQMVGLYCIYRSVCLGVHAIAPRPRAQSWQEG